MSFRTFIRRDLGLQFCSHKEIMYGSYEQTLVIHMHISIRHLSSSEVPGKMRHDSLQFSYQEASPCLPHPVARSFRTKVYSLAIRRWPAAIPKPSQGLGTHIRSMFILCPLMSLTAIQRYPRSTAGMLWLITIIKNNQNFSLLIFIRSVPAIHWWYSNSS